MFKIILKDRAYRMSSDAFYSSGMHQMTTRLQRGHHPQPKCADDVKAICEDIMRHDVDACFLIGLGRMSKQEKIDFAEQWDVCSVFRVSALDEIARLEAEREQKAKAA